MGHPSAKYGINDATLDFMYIGPLKNYYYKNNDIEDLLIFLKPYSNKKIFLIDNLMTEFDYNKIPVEYDIFIIGVFGEIYHKSFVEHLLKYLHDKIIIFITSQKFEIPEHNNIKIFYLKTSLLKLMKLAIYLLLNLTKIARIYQ